MTDNRTEALEHEIDKLRTHNQALTNAFDRAERQLAQARIDAGGMRPHPSIYSSPICGQPHPRNDWRCTLAEGHTGPHSVSLTAYWEPVLERDVIEGEPQNGHRTFTKGDLREAGSGRKLTAEEIEAMVIAMRGKASK